MSKYVIDETTLTAIGNAVRTKDGTTEPILVSQLATRIEAIPQEGGGGGESIPDEAFIITGNCTYRFAEGGWDWFVEKYGDRITTKDITHTAYMFQGSKLKSIPFDLNLKTPHDASSGGLSNIFSSCLKLEEVPYIIGDLVTPTGNYSKNPNITNIFSTCQRLRYIPDDFFDQFGGDEFWTAAQQLGGAQRSGMFDSCSSLRKLPSSYVKLFNQNNSVYSCLYYNLIKGCYALDEVTNMPVLPVAFTSNCFSYAFNSLSRVNRFLFQTNEDGSPIVVNWKSQTISFTSSHGVCGGTGTIANFNSGITQDKRVTDDATYQALKDDPDWWTTDLNYSRYNRTSAVETINSLPDVSAGSGNTIKFTGAAGALTDGGAINTLTEEEIAVAAAKGWTVTFV